MDSIPTKRAVSERSGAAEDPQPASSPTGSKGGSLLLSGGRPGIRTYAVMHLGLLLYCIGLVFSKVASQHALLSVGFVGSMMLMGLFSGAFAFIWQQVLKTVPLSVAFMSSEISLLWMSLFGALFFRERITVGLGCGILLVLAGVFLVSREAVDRPDDAERLEPVAGERDD